MTISEKVAYLKGLADGMKLDAEKSDENRLLRGIIDVLEEVGLSIEDLEENTAALGEELDAVNDDLSDLEEAFFDDEDDDEDDDDDDFFETPCPNCGEDLMIDEDALAEGSVTCPHCKEKFSLSCEDDEECGCGCHHHHHHHDHEEHEDEA